MKQMEQQNVKYDPQIRKLQKERYADQGNDIAEEQLEEESGNRNQKRTDKTTACRNGTGRAAVDERMENNRNQTV